MKSEITFLKKKFPQGSCSYYTCLHSSFLGWIFIGCLAYLAKESPFGGRLYASGCYIFLVSFFLIALGIDGVPYFKRNGVVLLSATVPSLIWIFYKSLSKEMKTARRLARISFWGVILTLMLALVHEFLGLSSTPLVGAKSMV